MVRGNVEEAIRIGSFVWLICVDCGHVSNVHAVLANPQVRKLP